jgi:hypothetical protein
VNGPVTPTQGIGAATRAPGRAQTLALVAMILVAVLVPLGLRAVNRLSPGTTARPSYLPALEATRTREMAFDANVVTDLQALQPESGDTLYWRAGGTVTLAGGRTCPFTFADGNSATPAGSGLVKVTYNGTVCSMPVSGTQIVKRR